MYHYLIIFLLLIPSLLFGGELQDYAFQNANYDSTYVYEYTNSNDSPRIDQYNKLVGIPLGSPYCAAGVYYWYNEASNQLHIKNPLYRTGSTNQIYYNALKNPTRFKLIKPSLVRTGSIKLQTGDISLWSTATNFSKGHTAFVVNQITNNKIHTIEANTSPSNLIDEQREQTKQSKNKGGVYHKERYLNPNIKFDIKGFVRVR